MDWEERLDEWELEIELNARLEGSDWVTLERAAADTGVSRAALRTWYRTAQIPSRLVDGPHGPQRLVPLAVVAARAEASPRLRRTTERRLADQAQLEILRHRVDQLELRLAALEGRLAAELPKAEFHDHEGFTTFFDIKVFAIMVALSGARGSWDRWDDWDCWLPWELGIRRGNRAEHRRGWELRCWSYVGRRRGWEFGGGAGVRPRGLGIGDGENCGDGRPGNWTERTGGRFLGGQERCVSGWAGRGISAVGAGDERLARCVAPATGLLYTCVLRWLS